MTESIFSKVFSYRQRDSHSPLENFLTEILSFCLDNDFKFRNDFFKNILAIQIDKTVFNISTQEDYKKFGRPDIEITYGNTAILIECKVEANERNNQLKDYSSILSKVKTGFENKHIIFLTKYFEQKELPEVGVKLHLIRWFEVYDLINDTHKEITQQLKSFLKEQNMENVKNFTLQDMLALKTIQETMSKMDELLEQFKPEFAKTFGGFSKDSARSTSLHYRNYINYVTLYYNKMEYYLQVGFYWWWDELEFPYVGLCILMPAKKFHDSELTTILRKELKGWEYDNDGAWCYLTRLKPISEFIASEEDNIPAMKKFLEQNLKSLYDLKEKYPKLLHK